MFHTYDIYNNILLYPIILLFYISYRFLTSFSRSFPLTLTSIIALLSLTSSITHIRIISLFLSPPFPLFLSLSVLFFPLYIMHSEYRLIIRSFSDTFRYIKESESIISFIFRTPATSFHYLLCCCCRPHTSTEEWWRGPTTVSTHTGRWYSPI